MKEFIYIYNIKQAEFYIKSGLVPEEMGMSNGKIYFKFIRKETKELFDTWCKRKVS